MVNSKHLHVLFFFLVYLAQQLNAEPIARFSFDVSEHSESGFALCKEGRYYEAIEVFTKAIESAPSAKLHFARGLAYRECLDLDSAIADLEKAIALDVKFAAAYLMRGTCHADRQRFNEAIADLTTAIKLEPNEPTGLFARAGVWQKLGNFDMALSDLDKAANLDNTSEDICLARSLCCQRLGRWQASLAAADTALKSNPRSVEAWVLSGDAKCGMSLHSQALTDYERAYEIDSKHPMPNKALALILSTCSDNAIRDYPRAINHARALCESSRWRKADHIELLARVCFQSGDHTEAFKWQTRAIDLSSGEKKEEARKKLTLYEAKVSDVPNRIGGPVGGPRTVPPENPIR